MLRPSGTHSHVKSIVYIRSDKIHEIREMSTPKKCANCFFGWWVLFTLFNPVVYREVEEALPHLEHPRLLSEVNRQPFLRTSYITWLKWIKNPRKYHQLQFGRFWQVWSCLICADNLSMDEGTFHENQHFVCATKFTIMLLNLEHEWEFQFLFRNCFADSQRSSFLFEKESELIT
jgi:hypothetical protein